MDLRGRVVIITGASMGIGAALARLLVREGARCVLAARSEEKLKKLAAELGEENALAAPTDVTDPKQVDALIATTVAHLGGLDILVNNAGFGAYSLVEETNWEDFREMWEVNFFGAVRATLAALPHLKKRRGAVVNISSVAGRLALPYMAGYCATKFALNAISAGLRMELAQVGVGVVVVCPGRVRTEFRHNMRLSGQGLPRVFRRRESTGITAEEVARVTLGALRRGRRMVVVPWQLRLAIAFRALLPNVFDAFLPRLLGRG